MSRVFWNTMKRIKNNKQMDENKELRKDGIESAHKPNPAEPKYEKPKILLVDINEVEPALKAEGYAIESGTFGAPYRVKREDKFVPLISEFDLPNHTEQEIVVVDLVPSKILDAPTGEKHTSEGTPDWWVSCSQGIVDPRPRAMVAAYEDFDNILSHGGIFIIFATHRYKQDMSISHYSSYYGALVTDSVIDYDNWSFLSVLSPDHLEITPKTGREMVVTDLSIPLTQLLSAHIKDGEYRCTFRTMRPLQDDWIALAENKFKEVVSGAIASKQEGVEGLVFIFPQIKNKSGFLVQFLNEILPDLRPALFPHMEGGRWVHRPEYEIPKVVELKERIKLLEEETKQKVSEFESEIKKEQSESEYLYDLLRQTGDPLVHAVKRTLEGLGFKDVIDVDEEKAKAGEKGQLREDLQVRDKSPLLLIEVKGISGFPREAQSLQVWKYIAPRMRQLDRTDIHGLSIVNHQKNIPALERDNDNPFGSDIVTNAEDQSFGLLTTFDLYRLLRTYIKNGWKHEHIEPLFYQSGRISPIPVHYEFIGITEHYYDGINVVSIRIEAGELHIGDRIAFELPIELEEQNVESMQIGKTPVDIAETGSLVGTKTHLTKHQAKDKKLRVFRVKS
jgi:hypothetical protein